MQPSPPPVQPERRTWGKIMDDSPEMVAALTAYHEAKVSPNSGTRDALEARLRAVLDTHDCVECDIYCLSIADLKQRNLELTRQVEQLRARVELQGARLAACENLSDSWLILRDVMANACAHDLKKALNLTAPPSSSDPGRNDSKGIEGDTGREER